MTERRSQQMKREGKILTDLGDGHPRRMSDGRNAVRKMNKAQRQEFVAWIAEEFEADLMASASKEGK